VTERFASRHLPLLPLLLWRTPPGLERILAQEGVSYERVGPSNTFALARGRFVCYDGRGRSAAELASHLSLDHVGIDIDRLRHGWSFDPFEALVDNQSRSMTWTITGLDVTERVSRYDKAAIRRKLSAELRRIVWRRGGLWARLSAFPYPYRAAFGFRVDLDEPAPEDYTRFAAARAPIADCTTHFLNTFAYGDDEATLADLRGLDVQSHAHYHTVYRDAEANRRNLRRAHERLVERGFDPEGFAAPEGRWNPGLDDAIASLGYRYSSDFSVGYDDLPFYPWRGDRFSSVLQVPVHPICEGVLLEAGATDGRVLAAAYVRALRARLAVREPAFLYGHPERRLARYPEVIAALAREIGPLALLWRVTLTRFADWWQWRAGRRWSILPRPEGRFEILFDGWDDRYPLSLEIERGDHTAHVPIRGPRLVIHPQGLAFERRDLRVDLPSPAVARRPFRLKDAVRSALRWETITPVEELPDRALADRIKKRLRVWMPRRAESTQNSLSDD